MFLVPLRNKPHCGIAGIRSRRHPFCTLAVAALLGASSVPAAARVLMVGPGQPYATPSAAARDAAAGDEVDILPGTYYDCAVWGADRLTIAGAGAGRTVLTDTACEGKASLVIRGNGVIVRDLTLARIRVPDGNGAGIRAEGADLTVERVRFENDQQGVLAGVRPGGTLRVLDCVFADGGTAEQGRVAAALAVGPVARLDVRGATFTGNRAGIAISSQASLTTIGDSRIAVSRQPSGATVQVAGGLVMENATVQAGPVHWGGRAAVLALPGPDDTAPLILRRDRLEGAGALLLNWSGRRAVLEANSAPGGMIATSAGAWLYRLRSAARDGTQTLYHATRHLGRQVLDLVHGG
jgi:hypothetical protein